MNGTAKHYLLGEELSDLVRRSAQHPPPAGKLSPSFFLFFYVFRRRRRWREIAGRWVASGGAGWPWAASGGAGRLWPALAAALAGSGRRWPALAATLALALAASAGLAGAPGRAAAPLRWQPLPALADAGRWPALAASGRRWQPLAGAGRHCGNGTFQTFHVNNNIQEFQEIEVMRDNNLEPENQLELDNTSNGVELHDHSTSVTKRKHSFDPILEDILVSREEPLPSTSHAKSPMSTFDCNIANREISSGQALPHLELELQPSPPVRERKRKRRMKKHSYDEKIVLSNADMKKQLEGTTKLVCKRRKLPCSVLDLYKYHIDRLKDQLFHEPLLSGMCSNLQEVFSRSFALQSNNSSYMEVSSELANELPHVASEDLQKEPEQQNNLDGEIERQSDSNMELEQQNKLNIIPENSRFDMHTDIQLEQQDELDLIPVNPRFDMHIGATINETIQLPSGGVDMTPFYTTTASSTHDFGKTFDTEILPTVESFTRTEATSYATGANLFSLEEEPLQNSMPRIPSVLLSVEEDFDFLDASTQSSGYKENEAGTLSARTRAVAQFFKNQSPPQSRDKEHGVLSLNDILEGKTRRRCAQLFFKSLVLKTCGFVDVQQAEAYGDIVISPTPALFATKF
ncbi:sister chromatid cohesion 1 protein 3-like [Curcuma longa]|uniref:sister chromatid cohesion 1 protein 3-like n=1 Tax=Curcuma longa TaxID=136217 RepID=UPI003D9DF7E7